MASPDSGGAPAASGSSSSSHPWVQTPVFIFPPQLEFYFEDKSSHKRLLTIYNPYDREVRYKGK